MLCLKLNSKRFHHFMGDLSLKMLSLIASEIDFLLCVRYHHFDMTLLSNSPNKLVDRYCLYLHFKDEETQKLSVTIPRP